MNRIPSLAIAATLALAGATSVSTAQAAERVWTGATQQWTSSGGCKLIVQQVSQPTPGQPIHVVVRNATNGRLRYSFSVAVVRAGKGEFRGRVLVDNANPGEVSNRPTETAYGGSLKGASVSLAMTSCSVRG